MLLKLGAFLLVKLNGADYRSIFALRNKIGEIQRSTGNQLSYANLTGTQHRAYTIKVERILWPCELVKLGVFLLVKLNSTYRCRRVTTGAFALYAIRLVKLTPSLI
jgi:hypothetical protein